MSLHGKSHFGVTTVICYRDVESMLKPCFWFWQNIFLFYLQKHIYK